MFDPSPSLKKRSPPPWQIMDLIAHHLDTTTLAIACCVSKSWSFSFSNDHLWQNICTLTYPSLSNLRLTTNLPYHKLYSLGRSADTRLRKPLPKPRLSLLDFMFAIDIRNNNKTVASIVVPGKELDVDRNGVFRFDVGVGPWKVAFDELDSLRITWNVVLEGYKGVFTMMDCKGKGNFVLGLEGWFSKELPNSGCCCWGGGGGGSGLVAELRLGLMEVGSGGGKVEVGKMSVGVLSVMSWRYVLVDDALRYLQHFLLPS